MVESTMAEFESEIKSAWVVKVSEMWPLGLWLLEQKNCESRACSCSTPTQNLENPNHLTLERSTIGPYDVYEQFVNSYCTLLSQSVSIDGKGFLNARRKSKLQINICMCPMYGGLPGLVKVFPSVSHSTGHTEALPQGASGYVHNLLLLKYTNTHRHSHTQYKWAGTLCVSAWHDSQGVLQDVTAYGVRVALQRRVNLAQAEQLVLLQETCFNPHGVQGRSSVALWKKKQSLVTDVTQEKLDFWILTPPCPHLGQDEAVTVEVPRVFRAVLHGVEVQHRHDFCHTAAWCGVSVPQRKT